LERYGILKLMPADLVINPNFWLESTRVGREAVRVTSHAPVKGRGLQYFVTDRKENPEMFRWITDIERSLRGEGEINLEAIPESHRQILFTLGILVTKEELPKPVRFSCFLDEKVLPGGPNLKDPIVNPTFFYQAGDRPPESIQHQVAIGERFLSGYPLVWVQNPGNQVWVSYWVKEDQRKLLSSLRPGEKPPASPESVDPQLRSALETAEILVLRDFPDRSRKTWESFFTEARAQFQAKSYVKLPDLIPPLWLSALRRYYRDIIAEGYAQNGDPQVALRRVKHHEDIACFLHPQFAYLVSRIAGRPLRFTHDYFYSYERGAVLDKHVDVDHDEFGISLLIDYDPEPPGVTPWPLFLENRQGPIEIAQRIGDAVFYNGCELPHYRHALPEGHRSTSLLFHFVPQNFKGRIG